jgi:ATP-dependent helicase HrpA
MLYNETFLNFPENLPVSGRRKEIAELIAANKVVIVCGETGSGKTTQLPKICTLAGCGMKGLIGHTQPRRLAATTVAKRIADELKSPIGVHVGYKIRFNEKFAAGAKFKLMTDGILLAETLSDPLLRAYDTIIIDEAHERSLNIDFLLGYLKQLLEGQRKDLKVIVTSATIDAQRFADHFTFDGKPAPVIEVSGRLYPVEIRYQGPEKQVDNAAKATAQDEDDEDDLPAQIEAAIEGLWREKMGDVLVFLPGEREIREATDHFRRLTARQSSRSHGAFKGVFGRPGIEVLPLFSKLAATEQQLIFSPGQGTRIVLATNVAETSVTVPNIRYVVDTGTARVKRYRYRSKVEQLQVEPISQAAANQRAGRCGRVMDGICVRLYDEADFNGRPKFTDPEILRSSLAAVILRMKALKFKAIEEFPFLEMPSKKAIADGYALLQELDAVDERGAITAMGQQLSRLPLDPRVARMLLAARSNGCLNEVLIIASALSVQDPRERPMTAQQAADQQHKRFADEKSDFMSFVKLWNYWLEVQKQHAGSGQSKRSVANRMDREFISSKRLREWADVHSQLAESVQDLHWSAPKAPRDAEPTSSVVLSEEKALQAKADAISKSLLTGLLGNLGFNPVDESGYMGTHQVRFMIHPGSALAKKPPRWVMCAELVETTRLYARAAARIDAPWIEQAAQHLIQVSYNEPHWEKQAGQVVAFERGMLYGLLIYSQRRVNYGAKDQKLARDLMIRAALVSGDWDSKLPFFEHNRKLIKEIEKLEHQIRRPDLLVDDELLFQWFDARIPEGVWSGAALTRWWLDASKEDPTLLFLDRDLLLKKDAGIDDRSFPKMLAMRGFQYRLEYKFDPSASDDGVTMILPIYALNQVDAERCEWLVPGMLNEKIVGLIKTLPPKWRRHFVPLAAYAERFIDRTWPWKDNVEPPRKALVAALLNDFQEHEGLKLTPTDFRFEALIAHSQMNYKLVDEHGATLAMSRNIAELRAQHGGRAQTTFQAALQKIKPASTGVASNDLVISPVSSPSSAGKAMAMTAKENIRIVKRAGERYTEWKFGELPELMELDHGGATLLGYPAIVDKGDAVEITVFDEPDLAATTHRFGLSRLFAIALKEQLKFFEKNIPDVVKLNMLFLPFGSADDLKQQLTHKLIDRACLQDPLAFSEASFAQRLADSKPRLNLIGQEIARHLMAVLTDYAALQKKLPSIKNEKLLYSDIEQQLSELLPKKFLIATESAQLQHMPRYLKGIAMRIDKYRADPARDVERSKEMAGMLNEYRRAVVARKGNADAKLTEFGWLLQELRISLFAQELKTPMPVSVKRIQKAWQGAF